MDDTAHAEESLPIAIGVEYADRVNFAMQQDGVPLVERISLTNIDEVVAENVVIKVALENGECEPWSQRIERIDSGNIFNIEPDGLRLRARSLATRTEAERTVLHIVVESNGRSVCKDVPIELLAFDQWPGAGLYPELLAAFVTPNHPKVAELLRDARKSLGDLSGGQDALEGYQSGSRQRAAQIAEACFNAVLTRGIGYISSPASFDREGQRIRLVDRICRENFGSCLDLSLLLSSLWEQVGLHPLVLLFEGHAMPAVWTHESHLPEPAIDEAARIRNLIELGEIVPVESTLVTQPGATFAGAVDSAKKRMQTPGSGFCAVDILSGRKRGVRPLPLRVDAKSTELDLKEVDAGARPEAADTLLDRVALADRAEGRAAIESTSQEEETGSDRIERWKTRLLDLSLRNRLINFRQTGRTVRLMVPDVARLEDMLADETRFSIYPKTDGDEEYLRQQLVAQQLYTSEAPAETQKRLLLLYRTSRSSIEETGANLLHLAVGMLKWFESESSETPRYAPLILLPVKLIRNSTGFGYRYDFSLSDEPLRPNVTLLEKLRTDFGIETDGLDDLPEDEHGLDVPLILRNFRAAIRDTSRWEVEESVFLGLFSFNKFLMWRDLQENMDRLRQNRLVRHFVDPAQEGFDPDPFPRPEDLDDQVKPGELYCTRDADATQLAAIRAAADKRTFVLEGPPGTGKSQTIANIIADSLARGKRVLFVAEKMAALSVVRHRLEEDGLGPFCLELHSAKASKKDVLAQLQAGLNATSMSEPPEWTQLCEELKLTRDQLNTYVRELHEPRATGESLYQVLGRLSLLGEGPRVVIPTDNMILISQEQLGIWRREIVLIQERAGTIDPPHEHPLRGIGRAEWSFSLPEEVRECLSKARDSARQLDERVSAFLDAVGIKEVTSSALGRDAVQVLAIMANELLHCPLPNSRLLIGTDAAALIADLHRLIEQGKLRDAKRNELLSRYREEFLELDHLVHLDAVNRAVRLPGPISLIAGLFARRKFRPYCTAGVEAMPNLLPRLKPCFLMSPLSIAQYLNTDLPPFDLVVFDEASQIPVWDAIGAIARGSEVIVVGDSKQLPPTNFFNTIDGDDDFGGEDFAIDDMESILKECNASGIPSMQLRWHYRSRHESLIAFSNHHYYENRLHTFPSPEECSAELGVTFRYIADGVYDRGVSRTNRIEACRVVEEVVLRLRGSNTTDSIGVVTFNQAQQSLIEDLLDAKRRDMPEIEPFFTNEVPEPVFVKNLENVQGDERDTIIFSVGYGPDQTGKPSMNFGPLNKDGGERRLNVAITRARWRLIVFSSLRSDQIDLKRTRSLGVKHFKTFLDYADRGSKAIAEAIDYSGVREFDSGFERAVWKALTDRGWEVDTQIGCAGYRIDLAVRDPNRPGRYLIGIECDGAAYHSAKTARDRDRLRQSVLEGLGWRIERIWSTEWRINPDRCIAVIEQAIDDAKNGVSAATVVPDPAPKSPASIPASTQQTECGFINKSSATQGKLYADGQPTVQPAKIPRSAPLAGPPEYKEAKPSDHRLAQIDIYDHSSTATAAAALGKIVSVEGPIVEELALRRLAEWFGDRRVTERYRDRFAEIREAALQSQPIRLENGVFWPADSDPTEFTTFRVPGSETESRRDLQHIPLIERVNAVVHVLGEQFGLPRQDLESETAKLFGMQRASGRTRVAISEAVELAIVLGRATCNEDQITVPAT